LWRPDFKGGSRYDLISFIVDSGIPPVEEGELIHRLFMLPRGLETMVFLCLTSGSTIPDCGKSLKRLVFRRHNKIYERGRWNEN
jgi:hypothetical protein